MAVDKLVDSTQLDADLAAVADAIRTKGGTSASLTFPNGFVDAIDAIETGGGGYSADDIASYGTISGPITISLSGNQYLRKHAFYCTNITSVDAPTLVRGGGNTFDSCEHLVSVNMPMYAEHSTTWGSGMFVQCSSLEIINAPYMRPLASQFDGCSKLKLYVNKTSLNQGMSPYAFRNCSSLETLDLTSFTQFGASYAWNNTAKLSTIILRRTDAVIPLNNANNVPDSMKSNGIGCTVYVPSTLKTQYETATNWSMLVAGGNLTFAAIEGSSYETQYADGTPVT